MKNTKTHILILIASSSCAIILGLLDYETESIVHLFTAEPGNIIALLIYTLVFYVIFAFIGFLGWILYAWISKSNLMSPN